MLIARDRSDLRENTVKRIDAMRDVVIKGQKKDGSWVPGGQLPGQKRPLFETTQVSTMLCVLGLDSLDLCHSLPVQNPLGNQATSADLDAAIGAWLTGAKP